MARYPTPRRSLAFVLALTLAACAPQATAPAGPSGDAATTDLPAASAPPPMEVPTAEVAASPDAGGAVAIASFEDCVAAGFPVEESYPRQCRTPDGQSFTEDIGNALEVADLIVVEAPRPGDAVASPLTVRGRARGGWYFEAQFPVGLEAADGAVLAGTVAMAEGNWMTEDFVPFSATLAFEAPAGTTGRLVLRRDNPSGLPENDAQLVVPVRFGP